MDTQPADVSKGGNSGVIKMREDESGGDGKEGKPSLGTKRQSVGEDNASKKKKVAIRKAQVLQAKVTEVMGSVVGGKTEKKMAGFTESDMEQLKKKKAGLMKRGIDIAQLGINVWNREMMRLYQEKEGEEMEEKMSRFAKEVGEKYFYPGLFMGVEDAKEKLPTHSWVLEKYWKDFEEGMANLTKKAASMKEEESN